jgi:hypothetical protein
VRDFRKHDHKFIAILAAYRVGFADAGPQSFRYRLQEFVANGMPKGIIDALETIQIQEQQCELVLIAAGE